MERRSDCWKVYIHIAPNCKKYIGVTSQENMCRRTGSCGNGYKKNEYFWRAIQKYGWDNFTHEIIADNLSCEEALKLEIKLIAEYNTTDPEFGYNITAGGNGVEGGSLQPVDRVKLGRAISKKMKGKPSPRKGKHITEEHKNKISESLKGHKHSEETKRKIGEKSKGRKPKREYLDWLSEHRKHCKWYNNGKVNVIATEQPEGFVSGRVKRK